MTWAIRNTLIGAQAIADTSTTQRHPLGTIVFADDPTYGAGEFIYLLGVANTIVGSWVLYNADDWSTSLLVANDKGPVAIAMSANVASQYGWYQISGKALGQAGTVASNADVFIESAGIVNDASVTGDRIELAKTAGQATVQTIAEFEIHRPFARDGVAV